MCNVMQTLSVQFDNSMNRTQQTHHCNCLFELLSFVHLFCDETFSFLSVSVQGDSFLVCRKWRNTFPVNICFSHFTRVWVLRRGGDPRYCRLLSAVTCGCQVCNVDVCCTNCLLGSCDSYDEDLFPCPAAAGIIMIIITQIFRLASWLRAPAHTTINMPTFGAQPSASS